MKYYIRTYHDGLNVVGGGVWKVEANSATRIDVSVSDLSICDAIAGLDIISSLENQFPGSQFYELKLAPGEYYPRIARPSSSNPTEPLGNNPDSSDSSRHARAKSTGQLHALIGQLEDICRVVHPEAGNLQAFGHEIRNVLILACTEVEMHWKDILEANGTSGQSTRDYVGLSIPMRLSEYKIDFTYYPWIEPIKPFEKWGTSSNTSQDIKWYHAYNKTKHNRDANFSEATLENAFQAVAACFVMIAAQHGRDFAFKGENTDRAFLRILQAPRWDPSEVYVPPFDGILKSKHYVF